MALRSNPGRSPAVGIFATVAALLLVFLIAGPALAQSPTAGATDEATPAATATAAATAAASPGGQPGASPTQPDTAIGDPRSTDSGGSPIAFLLLGIAAVAAVLVYLGMRGSQLRREPAGSDRNPPA